MRKIRGNNGRWLVAGIGVVAIITACLFLFWPDQIKASWEDDEPPPDDCAYLCEEDVAAVCDLPGDCGDGDGLDNVYECEKGWDPCDPGDPVPEDCEIESSISIDYHTEEPSPGSDSCAIRFYEAASSASMRCVGYSEYETSDLSHDVRWDAGPYFEFELSLDDSPEEVTAEATVIIDTEWGEIDGKSDSMTVDIHNLIQGYWDDIDEYESVQDDIEDAQTQEEIDSGSAY